MMLLMLCFLTLTSIVDAASVTRQKSHPTFVELIGNILEILSEDSDCQPGEMVADDACVVCPAGTFSNVVNAASCTPCTAGTFQDQEGQTSCAACAAGSFQDQEGQTSCSACAAGSFQDKEGQASCSNCAAGTYQDQEGQASCSACAAGSFQDKEGQASCSNCAAGNYQDQTGQSSCLACTAGSFQDEEGQASCSNCAAGTYQDQEGQTACSACAAGSFQDKEGQALCSPCAAGSFQDKEGQLSCTSCAAGSYQGEVAGTSCMLCSKGSYQENTGSASCNKCRDERTYTTYNEGSVSVKDCQGPLLSYRVGEKGETQFMTDAGPIAVKTMEFLELTVESGNWMIRNPDFPYRKYFIFRQGDGLIYLETDFTEWLLEPVMGGIFCYKDVEGNGKYFSGYQTKDAQGSSCDDNQFCRNSDSLEIGPHCMVNNKPSSCGIPTCVWEVQCSARNGIGYRGSTNAASSKGKSITCQAWNKDWPHVHPEFHPSSHNEATYGVGHHNFCRNPDPKNNNKPWCYTSDFWVRWAYCDVPMCDASLPYFEQK